jgi:hypothetical protein
MLVLPRPTTFSWVGPGGAGGGGGMKEGEVLGEWCAAWLE